MYVMVDCCGKRKIVRIINVSGTAYTDVKGNKYNVEKVQYIWKKKVPIKNPRYVVRHLLKEKN